MQNKTALAVLVLSSSFAFGLDGLDKRDPARCAAASSFALTQAGPQAASDVHRAVVLVGLGGDLHLLDDELQEVVLFLQNARHLFHPAEDKLELSYSTLGLQSR